MKLYSFNLVDPQQVDVVGGDKVLPPMYRTVQNVQPVPRGAVQKRNGILDDDFPSGVFSSANREVQLVSYVQLQGSTNLSAIAAVSNRTTAPNATDFYSYDTSSNAWNSSILEDAFGDDLVSEAEDGVYYVANALDTTSTSGDTELVTVIYNSAETVTAGTASIPCCFSFTNAYGITKFSGTQIHATAIPAGTVWTGNWKSAQCCEYHLGKLWVGGLVEVDYTTAVDSTFNSSTISDATTPTVTIDGGADNDKIIAGTVIKINDEEMAVTAVGGTGERTLTVTRGANNTTAIDHADVQDIFQFINNKQYPYRIRWSKSYDWKTNYDGLGAGSFESPGSSFLEVPTVGDHRVVGMRTYRGRLYVLTSSDLFVVTGSTTAQFGMTQLFSTPGAIGATLWATDRYLFWVDGNGIHQFNGSQEKNLSEEVDPISFKALNVDQYDLAGDGIDSRMPTAFVNEKLKIYGVHFPFTNNTPGKVTWLCDYARGTISQYKYAYKTNISDITYVSAYNDNGSVWMGTSNAASNTAETSASKYYFEPVDNSANAKKNDWGTEAVSTVLETGDINFAMMQGLSYEDAAALHRIDLYVVPDSATDLVYKLDMVVDNDSSSAQQTVTVSAGSSTQPVLAMMPLPPLRTGSFFKFTITEETSDGRGDLRRVDIFYDIRAIRGATR